MSRRCWLSLLVVVWVWASMGCATTNKSVRNMILAPQQQQQAVLALDTGAAERYIFDLINRDRRDAGMPAVEWDETAARAARAHAQEMAQNDYLSHWNLDGQKPPQRYRLAGGMNRTAENAAYARLKGYAVEQAVLLQAVEQLQQGMMAETPPNDGHRKTILDRFHTYVGVGAAVALHEDGGLTIAFTQEFGNRYIAIHSLPLVAHTQDSLVISGRVNQPDRYQLTSVQLLWEKAPAPKTIEQLKATHSYSGPDFSQMCSYALKNYPHYYYDRVAAKGSPLRLTADGTFSAPLQISERPGLNYLYVWLRDNTTGNEFIASELVIEVR